MDALSDVLGKIELTGAVYFKSDFSAPWGMEVPDGPFAQFHLVTKGACLLKTPEKILELSEGDLIIFPRGTGHWLADSLSSKTVPGMEVVQSIVSGQSIFQGESVSTTLVCGHFEFDRTTGHSLIRSLPELIYITNSEVKEKEWLCNIVNLIIQESEVTKQGNEVVIRKLGEILFIHALRVCVEQHKIDGGFLTALGDERISKGLKLIHNAPEKNWTLESLARSVGMSRTSLSNKFRDMTGETPMSYLTNWRILSAKELLKKSNLTVREVAHQVGYQSETSFNRVFKDRVQTTPLRFRNT